MEDLILYSHTYDEHIQLLRLVFRTADERNVSFNRKKTTFAVTLLCLRVMWFQNMDFAQIPTLPAPSENSPSLRTSQTFALFSVFANKWATSVLRSPLLLRHCPLFSKKPLNGNGLPITTLPSSQRGLNLPSFWNCHFTTRAVRQPSSRRIHPQTASGYWQLAHGPGRFSFSSSC